MNKKQKEGWGGLTPPQTPVTTQDVPIIIGAGLAGLMAAIELKNVGRHEARADHSHTRLRRLVVHLLVPYG